MAESKKFGQTGFTWKIMDENSRQHTVAECLKRISGRREGPLTESDGQVIIRERRMD